MSPRNALILANSLLAVGLIGVLLIWPAASSIAIIRGGDLASPRIAPFAYDWHASLSRRLAPWAVERVASGRAAQLDGSDIAGTEWPLFSSVFYLWATESLQAAARDAGVASRREPAAYAAEAIEAAARLVADPGHAAWVRAHWGDDYLERENLFYRMLLISGLTSYQALTGNRDHEALLRAQVVSLAAELDASPHGLLDDYPGECYPIDIVPAIAAIARADRVLGTDHSATVARGIRGFESTRLDPATDLPAYYADSRTGAGSGDARGVGAAFMIIWAAEIWPQRAREWYRSFETHFWQRGAWVSGFREFPKHRPHGNFIADVDAGPVVYGLGTTASAFGIGAARSLGRFDHAQALGAQAFATMLPMIDGSLLGPRAVSDLTDAPFTGEAIMLFAFTRPMLPGSEPVRADCALPKLVTAVFGTQLLLAAALLTLLVWRLRRRWRDKDRRLLAPWLQWAAWLVLMSGGLFLIATSRVLWGLAPMLIALGLPALSGSRATQVR